MEEPVHPWNVVVIIVEREHDRPCVPYDLITRNKPIDSRIGAVVPIVPQHQVTVVRNLDRAKRAQAASPTEFDSVRLAVIPFDCEYRISRVLNVGIPALDAVDDQ